MIIAMAFLTLLSLAAPASARVVSVEEGDGHGFLFSHQGNCFLILPGHVHGRTRKGLRLTGYDPEEIGSANVHYELLPALDLSLGLVRGALAEKCGPAWADLPRRLDGNAVAREPVGLLRHYQGSSEVVAAQVRTVTFDRIEVTPVEGSGRSIFAGSSGAFLFQRGQPVGMLIEAGDTSSGWAIRMDEITARLARFVEGLGATPDCTDPSGAARLAGACGGEDAAAPTGLGPYELVRWQPHAVDAASSVEALLSGRGPLIMPLDAGPVELVFEAAEDATLSRVQILSDADGHETFVPKSIEIRVDQTAGDVDRSRRFVTRDMPPDGRFEIARGETYARRIILRIHSAWGGTGPVRIDSLGFE